MRLAQGEAHVIRQTREWLSRHGVSLEALQRLVEGGGGSAATERSKTLILVKNLASSVTQQVAEGERERDGAASMTPSHPLPALFTLTRPATPKCRHNDRYADGGTGHPPPSREHPAPPAHSPLSHPLPLPHPQDVSSMFAKYGELGHVLLAPANTLALVEFLEVGDAKRAFRGLAYTKLRDAPIFLEWAPVGVMDGEVPVGAGSADDAEAAEGSSTFGRKGAAAAEAEEAAEEEEGADGAEGCTLFVKNLNFKTSSDGLRTHFERHYKLRSATVVTKRGTSKADAKAGGRSRCNATRDASHLTGSSS